MIHQTATQCFLQQVQKVAATGVRTAGDPILRKRTKRAKINDGVAVLCRMMIRKLRKLGGQGLSAPQVGDSRRVTVIETRKNLLRTDTACSKLYIMINPVIVRAYGGTTKDFEGCFSLPGLIGQDIPRYRKVDVRYTDLEGIRKTETFSGYLARVVQHELDHLDGRLYIDRMQAIPDKLMTVESFILYYQ